MATPDPAPYSPLDAPQEFKDKYRDLKDTRAKLVPPPGWRAPLDWVNYPVPMEELQAEAAPGMLKGASKQLMQRSLGERGKLVYD